MKLKLSAFLATLIVFAIYAFTLPASAAEVAPIAPSDLNPARGPQFAAMGVFYVNGLFVSIKQLRSLPYDSLAECKSELVGAIGKLVATPSPTYPAGAQVLGSCYPIPRVGPAA